MIGQLVLSPDPLVFCSPSLGGKDTFFKGLLLMAQGRFFLASLFCIRKTPFLNGEQPDAVGRVVVRDPGWLSGVSQFDPLSLNFFLCDVLVTIHTAE